MALGLLAFADAASLGFAEAASLFSGCPDLDPFRTPSIAAGFDPHAIDGYWYEQAYSDPAQVGSTCQTLNSTASADGSFSMAFRVLYIGKHPFTINEAYTPTGKGPGLFSKRAEMPGGKLLELATVVVATEPSLILFSCLKEPLIPAVTEIVIATRDKQVDDAVVQAALALAAKQGIPGASNSSTKRVSHSGCDSGLDTVES